MVTLIEVMTHSGTIKSSQYGRNIQVSNGLTYLYTINQVYTLISNKVWLSISEGWPRIIKFCNVLLSISPYWPRTSKERTRSWGYSFYLLAYGI